MINQLIDSISGGHTDGPLLLQIGGLVDKVKSQFFRMIYKTLLEKKEKINESSRTCNRHPITSETRLTMS